MSEFLSETEGCDLLARLFRARGYSIERNLLFREYGVEFHADGWDAKARVGFEFLSSEDDDHDDLTLSEYQALAAAQQRGELALFIIDEVEPLSAADLALQATEFLDEVEEARRLSGPLRKKAVTAKKRAAGKIAAGAGRARKVVAGAGKSAQKKPVDSKAVSSKKTAAGDAFAKPRAGSKAKKKAKKAAGMKAAGKKAAKKKSSPNLGKVAVRKKPRRSR